jgi:2-hydroxy-6-oxonona-2,4-dienedioate hydrolase
MYLWPEIARGNIRLGFADAGPLRTRYIESGDSSSDEAVLFLHGTGGHLEAFHRNLLSHAEHFRTIAVDMIGHGYTGKPDHPYEIRHYVRHLVDFCDALGIARVHLHGESLGGWVAAQFAIDHPDRVATLTLNTAGGLNTDPVVMERVYSLTMKAVAEVGPETVRRRLEFLMHDKDRVTDDLVEMRLQVYSQPGFVSAMENILCLQKMDIRMRNVLTEEALTGISAPTLIIWTDHDPTAPVATGERFARAIPNSRLIVLEDCAHWPQWEKPDEFNSLHISFLLEHAPGA